MVVLAYDAAPSCVPRLKLRRDNLGVRMDDRQLYPILYPGAFLEDGGLDNEDKSRLHLLIAISTHVSAFASSTSIWF